MIHTLYLAIDSETYAEIFYDVSGQILLDANQIRLIVVELEEEEILSSLFMRRTNAAIQNLP